LKAEQAKSLRKLDNVVFCCCVMQSESTVTLHLS